MRYLVMSEISSAAVDGRCLVGKATEISSTAVDRRCAVATVGRGVARVPPAWG